MVHSARARRGLIALVVGATTTLAVLVAAAAPASADPVPHPAPAPKAPPTAEEVFARLRDADQAVTDASVRLVLAYQSSAGTAEAALQAQASAEAAKRALAAADRTVRLEKRRLRDVTVGAYVSGRSADDSPVADVLGGRVTDKRGQTVVLFEQVVKRLAARLRAARGRRAADARKLQVAAGTALRMQRTAADRSEIRAAAEELHRDALAHQAAVRRQLQTAASSQPEQIPVTMPLLGDPQLTPQDLAAWFALSRYHPLITTPVEFLAAWYIDEGRREGVRGDIAFAQAVLETGGFSNLDSIFANNYAGIGHCDSCPGGYRFPSAQLGVRAQIQLLKSYAVKKPTYVDALVDRRLHGPAGCCATWGDLTRKWATAPTYGPAIMLIYTDMVDFALRRHAALLPSA